MMGRRLTQPCVGELLLERLFVSRALYCLNLFLCANAFLLLRLFALRGDDDGKSTSDTGKRSGTARHFASPEKKFFLSPELQNTVIKVTDRKTGDVSTYDTVSVSDYD
jgi:hypothetical protein